MGAVPTFYHGLQGFRAEGSLGAKLWVWLREGSLAASYRKLNNYQYFSRAPY